MKQLFKNTVFFLILSLFLACGKQNYQPTEIKTETEKDIKITDTNSVLTKVTKIPEMEMQLEKQIAPIVTGVSKDCDSVCNAKNDEILTSLNAKIKQGKNELSLYYNKYTRLFTAYGKLQETKDSIVNSVSNRVENNNKTITKEIPVYIKQELSKEQKINLWTGRIFWVLLVLFLGWRFSRIFA